MYWKFKAERLPRSAITGNVTLDDQIQSVQNIFQKVQRDDGSSPSGGLIIKVTRTCHKLVVASGNLFFEFSFVPSYQKEVVLGLSS